ncbi:MAG: MarC family protein [Candidatus Eiseniibacteriota bacterium]
MLDWQTLRDIAGAFLLVYVGLFPIVDPVSSAPLFVRLTRYAAEGERPALARAVAVNSFFLLLGSMVVGSHVLAFFGISLPVLRVAGGIVVAALGWKLLQEGDEPAGDPLAGDKAAQPGHAVDAFYPLTMPLTVGPGSMSVAVGLGSQWPEARDQIGQLAVIAGGAVAGLVAMAITIYICYRYSDFIVRRLGPQGTNVLMRLSAFILFCIGIQIIWNGVSALIGKG